ncbi:MAG TPA: hypothetical protein VEU51_06225 [Candidatus Acidoferrales bacterium]|nr:hypothetical protein [Candidatus Acidoferrales bacterium]
MPLKGWVSAQDLDKARQRKKPGQDLSEVLVEMSAHHAVSRPPA